MRLVFALTFSFLLLACSSFTSVSLTNSDAQRDDGWPTATLDESGFDLVKMQQLTQRLESGWHPNAHMVLVSYQGKLVYEKYLSGDDEIWGIQAGHRKFDENSLHDLRSISKSVTSLLLGIALGDNFEVALSRPIIEYFPEFAEQIADGVERVTLRHVLTMSARFEWNEMEVRYSNLNNDARQMYLAADPVQFVLSKPLYSEPGERWYYNGGMTMLVAALIEKISGQPFFDFAHEKLGEPLGISDKYVEWRGLGIWRARTSLPSAASGLRARGRDLAKIGALMRNNGRWRGRQLVPSEWVRLSSQRHMEQTFPIWTRMAGPKFVPKVSASYFSRFIWCRR